ncbi:related to LAP3 - member of the GAL regulon [Melanopsichium pennsylvanicum]|uniref:Cysteine proteinase 1, mitochondrial n=2 Tax=Melanopsichium pennsylvanicum TaxID=63383 RepID=A0AAJ5C3H3_9BASI|nr:related to LAP3-member of the GAL regulon [Melanopsichium pennsylvanicum 4]SNX82620.1 related to LAP3 - member of the GAL regulon [Melanopsichium pennsylvanicum]
MGSSASKPVAGTYSSSSSTESMSEKAKYTVGVDSSRATAQSSSIINHHAADRLARIQAETLQRFGASASSSTKTTERSPGISLKSIPDWQASALSTQSARLAQMTLHNAAIAASLHKREVEVSCEHIFSHAIPYKVKPVVNQKNSGRCWLFATCNVIRHQAAKVLELNEFELSQSYLSFWDKLEKSNYFLENMIELADEALDQRVVGFLKTAPTNDGGQWDMVANLLEKYGVVPKSVFPESYNSSYSNQINWLVTVKLREYTLELRQIKKDVERKLGLLAHQEHRSISSAEMTHAVRHAQRVRKDEQMEEVYRMLVISLGTPPQPDDEFTYNYRNRDGKFVSIKSTPRKFLSGYCGSFDHKTRCSLIHDPRHPADRLITVERLGNVWEGTPISYVNTTVAIMRTAVVNSIKAGFPVFFGSDVSEFTDKTSGIMDPDLFGYEEAFNISLGLTKAQRIELGESSMTHAMVITAVHIDEKTGKVKRYRVENSWGTDGVGNDKGFMVMSDKWFEEFNYQIVVDQKFIPKHLWALFENGIDQDTIRLPPYDPLGALA